MNGFLKVNFLGFFFLSVIVGCSSENKEQFIKTHEAELLEKETAIIRYDSTMYIGPVKVGFSSLPVPTYFGRNWKGYDRDAESRMLQKFPDVWRDSLRLIFQRNNGKKKILVDIPYDEEQTNYDPIMESVSYVFGGDVANANAYQIDAYCYEYYYKIVLNRVNGDTLKVIGDVACSSYGTWLLSYNFDLGAEFTPNGLELFNKEGVHYQRVGKKLFSTWGVTEAKWINDSVVRLQKSSFDEDWNQQFTYVDMTILN